VLSRVIWGAQTALMVVVVAIAMSVFIGILLGLVSGYLGGWVDRSSSSPTRSTRSRRCCSRSSSRSRSRRPVRPARDHRGRGIHHRRLHPAVLPGPRRGRARQDGGVRRVGEGDRRLDAAHHVPPRAAQLHAHAAADRDLNASEAISTLAALGFLGFGIQPTAAAEWGYDLNKSISDVAAGIWWTAIPRARDRADGAGHHPHRREPQRPRRPAPARAAPRAAKKTPTPADAVAASQPASRELMGEVE
jgi:peptide/nickel transport system permease protein